MVVRKTIGLIGLSLLSVCGRFNQSHPQSPRLEPKPITVSLPETNHSDDYVLSEQDNIPSSAFVDAVKQQQKTDIVYPKGWGKKGSKLVYNQAGAASVAGQPIDFKLVDVGATAAKDGTFTPASMKGKVWLTAGIFTTCGSFCPNTIATAALLQDKIIKAGLKDKVGILLVGLDPETDKPKRLRNYADLGHKLGKGVIRLVAAVDDKGKHSATGMAMIQAMNSLLPLSKASMGLLSASDVAGLPVVDYPRHDGAWKAYNGDGQRLSGLRNKDATPDELLVFVKQKLTEKAPAAKGR